jgi:hypothetical protein
VTASNSKGPGSPATSRGVRVPVPHVKGCPAATGDLSGAGVGKIKLGMSKTQVRRAFTRVKTRQLQYGDFFCLTPTGIRVGYPSPKIPDKERTRLSGRVIWVSTASAYYAVHTIRVGATVTAAGKVLKLTQAYHVGKNYWYFAPNGNSNAIFKARQGLIQEIGIANKTLTNGTNAQRNFLHSFS